VRSTAHRSSRISDFQVTSQADRANRDIAEAPRFLICARAFRYSLPPPCEPRESCSCPWCKASRRWRRRNLRSSPTTSIVTFSTPSISRPGISYCLLLLMVYRNSTRGPWNNVGGDGIFSPIFADVILTQQHVAAACVVFGISVTTKVPCWHVGRPAGNATWPRWGHHGSVTTSSHAASARMFAMCPNRLPCRGGLDCLRKIGRGLCFSPNNPPPNVLGETVPAATLSWSDGGDLFCHLLATIVLVQ